MWNNQDGEDVEQKEIFHLILWQSEKEKEIEQRRGKGQPSSANPFNSVQFFTKGERVMTITGRETPF